MKKSLNFLQENVQAIVEKTKNLNKLDVLDLVSPLTSLLLQYNEEEVIRYKIKGIKHIKEQIQDDNLKKECLDLVEKCFEAWKNFAFSTRLTTEQNLTREWKEFSELCKEEDLYEHFLNEFAEDDSAILKSYYPSNKDKINLLIHFMTKMLFKTYFQDTDNQIIYEFAKDIVSYIKSNSIEDAKERALKTFTLNLFNSYTPETRLKKVDSSFMVFGTDDELVLKTYKAIIDELDLGPFEDEYIKYAEDNGIISLIVFITVLSDRTANHKTNETMEIDFFKRYIHYSEKAIKALNNFYDFLVQAIPNKEKQIIIGSRMYATRQLFMESLLTKNIRYVFTLGETIQSIFS